MIFPLFETFRYENGQLYHLDFHLERYQRSIWEFFGKHIHAPIFEEIFMQFVQYQQLPQTGLYRLRLAYNLTNFDLQIFPYERKVYRAFKPIECDDINYHLKFTDRHHLQKLLAQKDEADEVIIIKNGCVTDCTIGNLVFRSGNSWFTPNTPLLAGTQRAYLLATQQIQSVPIRQNDLNQFEEVRLINALNPLNL